MMLSIEIELAAAERLRKSALRVDVYHTSNGSTSVQLSLRLVEYKSIMFTEHSSLRRRTTCERIQDDYDNSPGWHLRYY